MTNRMFLFPGTILWLSFSIFLVNAQDTTGINDVVSGNNSFAFDLFAKLKSDKGNIFFSPYSISTALAMTYAGARGNTEKQMATVLHFKGDQKNLHAAFGRLHNRMTAVQTTGSVQLNAANSLWMQREYAFLPSFLDLSGKNYEAGFQYVDFKKQAEQARKAINSWVEKKTNDKIKDLIRPRMLDNLTRMVLANAIYFKGSWATPFDTSQTKDMPFWVTSLDSIRVKMMAMNKHDFGYFENETVQCGELPYAGNDISMVVILPKKRDAMTEVENSVSAAGVSSWIRQFHAAEMNVSLPKFMTTKEILLNENLSSLGMTDAFKKTADFSGMTGTKDLFMSAVIHKAFVDVNEEGTEAAAATAVVMRTLAVRNPPKPVVFRADHPFLFLIRDKATGSILFLGRIVNPLM
jgi:serine protease inhibitor